MTNSQLYRELFEILSDEKPCLLATVFDTHGSTPQKPGSSALFGMDGLITGTVGGGLVEHEAEQNAVTYLEHDLSGIMKFDLRGELQLADDVICGGSMNLLMDASPARHRAMFWQMMESLAAHVPGLMLTLANESKKEGFQINRYWITSTEDLNLPILIKEKLIHLVSEMLVSAVPGDFKSLSLLSGHTDHQLTAFLETVVPLPALLIAGAGHIGKALLQLGKFLDFEVTVWDDRPEFANKDNLPQADHILAGELDETLANFAVNPDTYIVIVTRGHKRDAEVLRKFIGSNAPYVGMIGSKNKVRQMHDYFLEMGWATRESWDKIHAPIGVEIGSVTVEEIAISIAAQIIQVRHIKKNADG